MVLCALVRMCGSTYLAADTDFIEIDNVVVQLIIKFILLFVEMLFTYKILCKTKFWICAIIAVVEIIIIGCIPNAAIVFIVEVVFYVAVPVIITKDKYTLIDCAALFTITSLYSFLFCYGRFGNISEYYTYSYIHGVLSTIDYKLLFVAIYLIIKNFGGIKLWKAQTRKLFQRKIPLPTK